MELTIIANIRITSTGLTEAKIFELTLAGWTNINKKIKKRASMSTGPSGSDIDFIRYPINFRVEEGHGIST